jgi:hypothetical protein
MNNVDHLLDQYSYSELLGNVKSFLTDSNYTRFYDIIQEALENLKQKDYDFATYLRLRSEIIQALRLDKVSKYNLKTDDIKSKSYSYKLLF